MQLQFLMGACSLTKTPSQNLAQFTARLFQGGAPLPDFFAKILPTAAPVFDGRMLPDLNTCNKNWPNSPPVCCGAWAAWPGASSFSGGLPAGVSARRPPFRPSDRRVGRPEPRCDTAENRATFSRLLSEKSCEKVAEKL